MKRLFLALWLVLSIACPSFASTYAQQVEFLLSQVRNSTGSLAGGTATFYYAGTTQLKDIWLDKGKTTPAANPYQLDSNATAALFADGRYKVVLKNSAGVAVYTRDNLAYALQDGPWVDVGEYADLTAAITAIGSMTTDLLIDSTTTLTANTVIPANVRLKVTIKGRINQGSYSLTFADGASVDFPSRSQVFAGTGAVTGLKIAPSSLFGSDPAAIQKTINMVQNPSNGIVEVPPGTYTISNLTLQRNVWLRGAGKDQVVFYVTDTDNPAITMKPYSKISGINFQYPNQVYTGTPTVYPPTIVDDVSLGSAYSTIEDIRFYNSYSAVEITHDSTKVTISDCDGFPLKNGILLDAGLDVPRIRNVHWNNNIAGNAYNSSTLAWVYQNATAFTLRRADMAVLDDCFAFGYYKGFAFQGSVTSTGSPSGVHLNNCSADICNMPISAENHQDGLYFNNCNFTGGVTYQGVNSTGLNLIGYQPVLNADIYFANSTFKSFYGSIIPNLQTNAHFDNCLFDDFNYNSLTTNGMIKIGHADINVDVINSKFNGQSRVNARAINNPDAYTGVNIKVANTEFLTFTTDIFQPYKNLQIANVTGVNSIYYNGVNPTLINGELTVGSIPTAGTWSVGDRFRATTPIIGQPKAWLYTVSGWVSEGDL